MLACRCSTGCATGARRTVPGVDLPAQLENPRAGRFRDGAGLFMLPGMLLGSRHAQPSRCNYWHFYLVVGDLVASRRKPRAASPRSAVVVVASIVMRLPVAKG